MTASTLLQHATLGKADHAGAYGRVVYLSAQSLDSTGATAVDAAFQALLTGLADGTELVIDKGTWKFATGSLSVGGKKVQLVFAGGTLTAPALSGSPLFSLGAGDKLTITGHGRITGPGKSSASANTNGFTLTAAPGGLFIDGDIEIDGWYWGIRPNGTSTGITVKDAYIHDCAFGAGAPHADDDWDIRCANNGTDVNLHHDLYVVGNDGGCSGARTRLKVRSTACAGTSVQLFSDSPNTVSGFDVDVSTVNCAAALSVGDFDTSNCTFHVVADGCTDRGIIVLGNVYGCEFTGTIRNSTGRNIDVNGDSAGIPSGNTWNMTTYGGGDAATAATNFFSCNYSTINVTAYKPTYDALRLSGATGNAGTAVLRGSINGVGLRLSGGSIWNDFTVESSGHALYDVEINPNTCGNNTVRGRGASHATLASNLFIAQGTTGLDLSGFIASLSSGTGQRLIAVTTAYTATNNETILANSSTRQVTDGVTATSTSLTSATASFVAGDVGREVAGSGIPAGTTIASVTNSTTVVLSQATIASASGVTVIIGGFTVTLPTAAGVQEVKVKKTDSGAGLITIAPQSGTIDGAAVHVLNAQYQAAEFICDGTNWWVI